MKMKVKDALMDENVTYEDFYCALYLTGVGNWDRVNCTETIYQYINEKMRKGVRVSHMLKALEENPSRHDWRICLGNSMETPEPINSKFDLLKALEVEEDDEREIILPES